MNRSAYSRNVVLWLTTSILAGTSALAQSTPGVGEAASQSESSAAAASHVVSTGAPVAAGLGEIVVTAEKRESSVQKTPLSITALSGGELARKGISSIEAIRGQVPGVAVNNESGTTKVNIRGLGLTAFGPAVEGSVAVYSNGVYLAHAAEIGASFIDVQRLEVLRGPQGTLYGRNSTGGAVNIIPNAPTEQFHAGATATYGNYNDVELNGFVSGAIVPEVLKARFALQYQRHDGYSLDVYNGDHYDGLDQGGFRGTLEYTPSDRLKVTLEGDYFRGQDSSVVAHYLGDGIQQRFAEQLVSKALNPTAAAAAAALITTVPPSGVANGGVTNPIDAQGRATNPWLLYQDTAPYSARRYYGTSLIVDDRLSDDISFKSITAYRRGAYDNLYDLDRTTSDTVDYTQTEKWNQFSEEAQFIGDIGKLNWIVGAYYLRDRDPLASYIFSTPPFGEYYPYGSAATDAYAVYGQATYAFTPELKLILGGRYSYEKRHREEYYDNYGDLVGPLQPDAVHYSKFTPKATIQFEPSNNLSLYATVSEGFKSGGFLITAGQGPVNPETLWDYEAGIKLRAFDHRLQFNLSAYHYDYKNIQEPIVNGYGIAVQNAASARVNGGELEITAEPVRDLRLSGSLTYIDGKFGNFITSDPQMPSLGLLNLKGNQLPFSSKWSYYLDAVYTLRLGDGATIEPDVAWTWRSVKYFDTFNLKNNYQPAVGTLEARLRYTNPSDRWYVEGFGKNLTNKFILSLGFVSGTALGSRSGGQIEPPRTYGIRFGINY